MLQLLLIVSLFVATLAQAQEGPRELLVTGTLSSPNFQFSLQAYSGADSIPQAGDFKIPNINLVLFGLDTTTFHNHSGYPIKVGTECDERILREKSPADAPFFERQTYGLTFSPQTVTSDQSGNLILTGSARANYGLLDALFPTASCANECASDACDEKEARLTSSTVTLRLSSTNGALSELQRIVRAGNLNQIETLSWGVEYTVESSLSREEVRRGFKDYRLTNSIVIGPSRVSAVVNAAIIDTLTPVFRIWRSLKVQPIGIRVPPYKLCLSSPCLCCTYIWVPDLSPTGTKGLNFGKPGADTQWRKSGITFDWQPIVYLTDGTKKVLDDSAEETALYNSYSDATAIEVFFARQFNPVSKYGGGFTVSGGTANAKVVTTEYMIDDCNVDFTHLAHELGHVLDLPHPPGGSPTSSTNTLMCPSGYCNDNPTRNSLENQGNANNPLITYYLSTSSQTADDCNNSADCGPCPF